MVIIGAGGLAKELIEIFNQKGETDKLACYDDVNENAPDLVFNKFPVLKNEEAAKKFFVANGYEFTIGIGNPFLRQTLYKKFITLEGKLTSSISPKACIGSFDVQIGQGSNILDGAVFSNSTKTGIACIVYYNSNITHDCTLGNFVQVSTGVSLLGAVEVCDSVLIGANATVLPKIRVGQHAVIAACSVVTKNVPDYALMMGNPARRTAWVSEYGEKLQFNNNCIAACKITGGKYKLQNDTVVKLD